MNIRQARPEDIDAAQELIEEFKQESLAEYGMDLDIEQIRSTVSSYIGTSLVAEAEGKIVGILAGTLTRLPIISTPIYLESVWYVSKAHRRIGIRLLKSVEELAVNLGCRHMIMAHMMNSKSDKLGKFYESMGFVPYEINYIKQLHGGNPDASSIQQAA